MGLLDKIFGKKQDGPAKSIAESIKDIKELEESLSKKEDILLKQIENEILIAKQCAARGDKRGAMAALSRKKRVEAKLTNLNNQLIALESHRDVAENSATNNELARVIQGVNKAMKVTGGIDLDKVQDIIEEANEQREMSDEIADLLASNVSSSANYTDAELLDELHQLEVETQGEQVTPPKTEKVPLPSVPSFIPTAEEAELEDLLKWSNE